MCPTRSEHFISEVKISTVLAWLHRCGKCLVIYTIGASCGSSQLNGRCRRRLKLLAIDFRLASTSNRKSRHERTDLHAAAFVRRPVATPDPLQWQDIQGVICHKRHPLRVPIRVPFMGSLQDSCSKISIPPCVAGFVHHPLPVPFQAAGILRSRLVTCFVVCQPAKLTGTTCKLLGPCPSCPEHSWLQLSLIILYVCTAPEPYSRNRKTQTLLGDRSITAERNGEANPTSANTNPVTGLGFKVLLMARPEFSSKERRVLLVPMLRYHQNPLHSHHPPELHPSRMSSNLPCPCHAGQPRGGRGKEGEGTALNGMAIFWSQLAF